MCANQRPLICAAIPLDKVHLGPKHRYLINVTGIVFSQTDFPFWLTFFMWQYQRLVQQMAVCFFVGGQGLKGCLAFEAVVA
jgi:hypothetical protein